jgi:hypothetical protein
LRSASNQPVPPPVPLPPLVPVPVPVAVRVPLVAADDVAHRRRVRLAGQGPEPGPQVAQDVRVGDVVDEHGALVATQTRDRVVLPHCRGEPGSGADEHLITDGVPVPVVDLHEVVEVDQRQHRAQAQGLGTVPRRRSGISPVRPAASAR